MTTPRPHQPSPYEPPPQQYGSQPQYPPFPGNRERPGNGGYTAPDQWAGYDRQAPQPQQEPYRADAPRNGLGIAAIILGPVGILFGLVPLTGFIAIICGIVGLVLGLVAVSRVRKGAATNRKTAGFGVVLSVLAIALGIWGMVIVGQVLDKLGDDLQSIGTPSSTNPEPVAADALCSYRSGSVLDDEAFAPCVEGERFAEVMRQLGYPDSGDVYMPGVAADSCARKAAGQPLASWSASDQDSELHRAFRQAEIAARCPEPAS